MNDIKCGGCGKWWQHERLNDYQEGQFVIVEGDLKKCPCCLRKAFPVPDYRAPATKGTARYNERGE